MKLQATHITVIAVSFLAAAAGVYALGSETLAVSIVTLLGGWLTPSPLGRGDA